MFLKKKTTDGPSKTPSICPFKAPRSTLRMGSTGEPVKWLQWHLQASVAPELPITGEFWSLIDEAVVEFQIKYGLGVDGIVGPATRAKLKEVVGA